MTRQTESDATEPIRLENVDAETFETLPRAEQKRLFLEMKSQILPTLRRAQRKLIREQLGVKPLGRMPSADSVRRDHKIYVRFNDAELASVQAVADADGVSLAETARTLALEAAARRQNPET